MTKEEYIEKYALGFVVEENPILEFHRNEAGEIHREDGPAIVYAKGNTEWYLNGKLHRDGGPAQDWSNLEPGAGVWYQHGKRHRVGAPAMKWSKDQNMAEYWYINGEMHREDGPAIDYGDGKGIWAKHDKIHREDGPAEYISNQHKIWVINGQYHREDGPAEITGKGKRWFKHGKLHRVDGPAWIYNPRMKKNWPTGNWEDTYWLDGVQYTKDEWLEKRKEYLENTK